MYNNLCSRTFVHESLPQCFPGPVFVVRPEKPGMLSLSQASVRQRTARFLISVEEFSLRLNDSTLLSSEWTSARNRAGIGGLLAFSCARVPAFFPLLCLRAHRFLLPAAPDSAAPPPHCVTTHTPHHDTDTHTGSVVLER